jgi:histidine kinase
MSLSDHPLDEYIAHTARHVVYRVTRPDTGEKVVLKRALRDYPLPDDVLRLEFERYLLEKLRGPGVVALLGFERVAGSPILVLEDFGARSLADHPLPLALGEFWVVAQGLIRALSRVHAAQVIHKDIKPSNVLYHPQTSVVKLIDFQLSAELSRERRDPAVAAQIQGSFPYMSPEQTGRMNRSLDYRSDYYSLGVTLFELLTGQLPFAAADMMGWVHCHVSKAPPLASDVNAQVPPMLARLVDKLMKKEPGQRYQSARGLLADLARIQEALATGRVGECFELGANDVSERFEVSQKLVGRASEVGELLDAFERASAGKARLVAIAGYSGVGKSALVGELQRPITSKNGYFVSGKFDQLDRSVPYGALLQALRQLVQHLLAASEARIESYRERIATIVGPGLSLIVEFLPELTKIVGPQPPAERVDVQAAHSRFKLALCRFIRALGTSSAPLAIVLDDLQWADPSTPELLVELVVRGEAQHLLLVGSYRDNEVEAGHVLRPALREIRALAPDCIDELTLAPLTPEALGELVASTLSTDLASCAELTDVIGEKSHGNPFFAGEVLTALYQQGAVRFDSERGQWAWEMDAVRAASVADNVIDLMVRRLAALGATALDTLKLAACLGSTFSLGALAALLETNVAAVADAVWEPTRHGLLVPLGDDYRFLRWASEAGGASDARFRFLHDRVREAAYSLIADSERASTHLRIGRRLLAQNAGALGPDELFAVCNHLNQGRALIDGPAERERLMLLNHRAANRALAAAAFGVAARYHDAAAECLTQSEWLERRALGFEVLSARVTSVLMNGERDRAARLCHELFAFASSDAQRAGAFLAKCAVMLHQANFVGAVDAVREGLALLGIELPSEPQAINAAIGTGIGKMQGHLARTPVDQLHELPELTDPDVSVAMQLLFNVVPAAIMVSPPLFVLTELLMFDLALSQGVTAICAKNFVQCGMIQAHVLGDFRTAYQLGKAAFRVMDRFGARALGSGVLFVFSGFLSSWGAPYEEALASCRTGKKLSIESGDLLHLGYYHVLYPRMLLLMGHPLSECEKESRAALSMVESMGGVAQALGVRFCKRAIERLIDASETPAAAIRADDELEKRSSRAVTTSGAFKAERRC